MNATDILKQVQQVELSTKRLVDGLVAGNYHSVFTGQGIEFSDLREYKPGDDVRNIDWNVTARYDQPYVKEFIEERDLTVYLVIDCSASHNFGNTTEKKHKSVEVAATLMFAALKNNDNVGMFLFTDDIETYVPVRKGRKHVLGMISKLVSFTPKKSRTDLAQSLAHVANIVKKRSIIFVLSDFMDTTYDKPLRLLHASHDVILVRLYDKREHKIPNVGLITLEDEETGEQLVVDTSDEQFRTRYAHLMKNNQILFEKTCAKQKIDAISLDTDGSYATSLRAFFSMRKQRRYHGRV